MTRFDAFCLRMILLCLLGAAVVGFLDYRRDILGLEAAARQDMPGCRKHVCTVHYEHGLPVVVMARSP